MMSLLHLDSHQQGQSEAGRSLAEYRAEKQQQEVHIDPLQKLVHQNMIPRNNAALVKGLKDWERTQGERGRPRKQVVPNTILEEGDSSDDHL